MVVNGASSSVSKLCSLIWKTRCRVRHFNTSTAINANVAHWREQQGLSKTGSEYGPLTDYPDWSYADGRVAPLGSGQKRRVLNNIDYCKQIVKLTKEIDEAKMLKKQKVENYELAKKTVTENLLKRKGNSMFPPHENE